MTLARTTAVPAAESLPDAIHQPVSSSLLAQRAPWLQHGFSQRSGGVSVGRFHSLNLGLHVGDERTGVLENRRRFTLQADLESGAAQRLVLPAQVHGCEVASVQGTDRGRGACFLETAIPGVDALATDVHGIPVLLLCADCVPILIADPEQHAFCAVHAGWKGTAGGIAGAAVRFLAARYGSNPGRCVAWIGPAIDPCCYQVSEDVADAVVQASGDPGISAPSTAGPRGMGHRQLDLKQANLRQLESAGLPTASVEMSVDCTCCNAEQYFSHRRDGVTGRMGLFAMKRA